MAVSPIAEFDVTAPLVRALLREQHPGLAHLPVTALGHGWDNELFRLGPGLVVRLPRREVADALMIEEQRWLPQLTAGLDVPTSSPVHVGVPDETYPWHWSVCRWIDGVSGLTVPRTARSSAAPALARFLAQFHRPAPDDAPVNPVGRGGPLTARDVVVRQRLSSLENVPIAALLEIWDRALAAPEWSGAAQWLHGDLHPANVILAADGALAGVVDFSDLCSGDPATDLAAAWLMFDTDGRRRFRQGLHALRPADADTWERARGWAVSMGSALMASSDDTPAFLALGRETLEAVLEP